jgi:hypothetical protein
MKDPKSKRQFKKLLSKMIDSYQEHGHLPDDFAFTVDEKYAGFNLKSYKGRPVRVMQLPFSGMVYLAGDPIFNERVLN